MYDAYIGEQYIHVRTCTVHQLLLVVHSDNELPDYIMVMIANGKTIHQINNDLNLFLADNADKFTAW